MRGNFVQGVRENGISMPNKRQADIGMSVDGNPLQIAKILMLRKDDISPSTSSKADGVEARLYIWNIQVSAAFWGGFHFLEILLRNAIHQNFVDRAHTVNWWETDLPLFDSEREFILEAVAKVSARDEVPSAPLVISQLHFAFWVGLLANKYHSALWVNQLETIFPNYQGDRKTLHAALDRLRKLRNRIAHHESIYLRDLSSDLNSLCSILGYIDSDTAKLVKSLSKVRQVLATKEAVLAGTADLSF